MIVTSKFNSKGIKGELMLFLVAAFTRVGSILTFTRKREIIISLIVVGIAEVVALLIWAYRMSRLTQLLLREPRGWHGCRRQVCL